MTAPSSSSLPSRKELYGEIESLRARLQEAEETLHAIRRGEVDALLVEGPDGEQVFTLRGAEHAYRILVETMNEGAVTLQKDGLIHYANNKFSAFLQRPLEKIIGSQIQHYLAGDQWAAFTELLQREGNRRAEFNLISQDGGTIPVLIGMSRGPEEESPGTLCLIITDLTEQKHVLELQKAKTALQSSEEKLQFALETARLGSWQLDLATGKIACTAQCKINDGFTPDTDLTYDLLLSVVHPDDKPRMLAAVQAAIENRDRYECEYRINRPDGTIGWVIANGRAIYNDEGVPVQMIGVTLETTGRKQIEESLRDARTRIEATLVAAEIGTWIWNIPEDRFVADKNLARLFSITAEEAAGAPIAKLVEKIHPDDRDRVQHHVEAAIESPSGIYETDYRLVQTDGSVRWVTARGSVERDGGGVPIRFPGVVIDITERKRAEEFLRESEDRFRTLAEAIPQLSWTAQADGQCDYLSQQWIDYTGVPMHQQLGFGWLERLHPDDRGHSLAAWQRAVQGCGDYDVEFRIRGKDSTCRWFKTRGIPVRDAEGKIVKWFGTCTDIEDINQARQVLARNREELETLVKERTAQLEETTDQLNNFCYSIAHDLRAPLRAQNAFATILLEDYGPALGEEGRGFAKRIINAAEKLDRLVQDLLSHVSLSRGDLPLDPVDLSSVVTQVRTDFTEQIHRAHATVTLHSIEGIVSAHEPSLNLVIANLLSNALKYCKPGVSPCITLRTERRDGHLVRLWIEDNGIGIKPEYHERIFGVFQRLHTADTYPGTGIGLALVRKGLERMGGRVGVESELGKGSRFWIDLPRAEAP